MAENISDSTKEARAGMATPEIMASTSAPVQYDPIRYEQQLSSGKWIECRGHPLPGGGSLAIYRDIGESKQLFAQLEELATTDALTAVPNRRSFLERAAGEFAHAKRT
ncbi:MAG: PAS-domain containing protein, partial [Alphaproteobacteria bacterium]|nr:PAS-domain containing protein [Alphaproteobacteria bacterium]